MVSADCLQICNLYDESRTLVNKMQIHRSGVTCSLFQKFQSEVSQSDQGPLFALDEDHSTWTEDFLPIVCDLLEVCVEYNDSNQVLVYIWLLFGAYA